MPDVTNQTIPLAHYRPHPRNYNVHPAGQVADLRRSLRRFGQVRSVVVQDDGAGGYLGVAGHGVVEAAQAEGWPEIRADVLPADWPPEKVLAYLAADNESGRASNPDLDQLAALVAELKEKDAELAALAAGGEARLKELLAQLKRNEQEDPGPQIDKAAELQVKWETSLGQMWGMGAFTKCPGCGKIHALPAGVPA
jgi:ParB-like chromosome segregation protein Spo0J